MKSQKHEYDLILINKLAIAVFKALLALLWYISCYVPHL